MRNYLSECHLRGTEDSFHASKTANSQGNQNKYEKWEWKGKLLLFPFSFNNIAQRRK